MKCIGFGEFEGHCQNEAGGRMLPKSKYWCDRCEKLRREHISNQFDNLLKLFDKPAESLDQ